MKRFLIRFLNRFNLLTFVNLSVKIQVDQKTFNIPIVGGLGLDNLNLAESWMTDLLKKVKPFFLGAFVDVGVNEGQTFLQAYSIKPDLRYIGFEPNPTCIHSVKQLLKKNGVKNAKLIPVGLGNSAEIIALNFFQDVETDSSASIIENFRPNEPVHHSQYVPIFDYKHIRSMLPEMGHCLLKIDVEGAELEVLSTLSEWIEKCQPLILIEILPVYTPNNEFRLARQLQIEALVEKWQYKIARVNKSNAVSLTKLNEIGIHGNIEECDYVFYPAELEPGLRSLLTDKSQIEIKAGQPVESNFLLDQNIQL